MGAAVLDGKDSLCIDGVILENPCRSCHSSALNNSKKSIGKDTPKKLLFTLYCFIISTVLWANTICALKNTAEPGGPSLPVSWKNIWIVAS